MLNNVWIVTIVGGLIVLIAGYHVFGIGQAEPTLIVKDSPNSISTVGQAGDNTLSVNSYSIEIPVGEVNAVNRIFHVSHKPVYLVIDGMNRFESVEYAYVDGMITLVPDTPPTYYIRSFYQN